MPGGDQQVIRALLQLKRYLTKSAVSCTMGQKTGQVGERIWHAGQQTLYLWYRTKGLPSAWCKATGV